MNQHIYLYILVILSLLTVSRKNVGAELQCNGCHGTLIPTDNRPLDATYRNISTGGFQGNHRTHMDAGANAGTCDICHPGSSNYTSFHREGKIKVSSHINTSLLSTPYKNSTSAWAQTATQTLGSCRNVNCHFETVTPIWGSNPALTTCNTCHGAPPAGTAAPYSGGADGSHSVHNVYYSGVSNCIKCHSDHTTEVTPFAHAYDISTRTIAVSPRDPLNNIYGSFSAGTRQYLPSQGINHTYGTCKSTYCHGDGTSVVTGSVSADTPMVWGSGAISCDGCHGFPPEYANSSVKANSHRKHADLGYGCNVCHAATTANGSTITNTTLHVNKFYNLSSGTGVSFTYVFAATGGTCSAISCHNNGTAVSGAALTCGDCHSVSPGGD